MIGNTTGGEFDPALLGSPSSDDDRSASFGSSGTVRSDVTVDTESKVCAERE